MKKIFTLSLLLLVNLSYALSASAALTEADLTDIKSKILFFNNKYYAPNVWDCYRSPSNAVAGEPWNLYKFNPPYDTSSEDRSFIDFGPNLDRYIQFDLANRTDNNEKTKYIIDDVYKKNNDQLVIQIKLYEKDGTLVHIISKYGMVMGLGKEAEGLFYEQEGYYGTFFTFKDHQIGDEITYTPEIGVISSLSSLGTVVSSVDCIVRFMDGEDLLNVITVKNDSKISRPADPTKENHTFQGWFTDNTFATEFDFNTVITKDTQIYAKFKDNSGVNNVDTDNIKITTTSNRTIIVSGLQGNDTYSIYDINGRLISTQNGESEPLERGCYIISAPGKTFKAIL